MFVEGIVTERELGVIKKEGYDIVYEIRNIEDAKKAGVISVANPIGFWEDSSKYKDNVWVRIFVTEDVYEYLK